MWNKEKEAVRECYWGREQCKSHGEKIRQTAEKEKSGENENEREKDSVNECVRQWHCVGRPKEQMSLMLNSTGSSQGKVLIIL